MSSDLTVAVFLFLCAALVVVAGGIQLARSGDEIARRTGLGGLLVGALLLAGATSLPELATEVSAVLAGAPDLAVGDLLGSSMANMAILALIDLVHRGHVWHRVSLGHARLAAVAIALTSIVLISILRPSGFAIGWVGIETVIVLLAYIAAAAWLERAREPRHVGRDRTGEIIAPTGWAAAVEARRSLRMEVGLFGAAALVVLIAAPVMTISAKTIATETGLGQTFVGGLLLAWATSLPEVVASLAAVRIGAYDLAVGNLFGSNAFNVTILVAADVAYTPGPILAAVAPSTAVLGMGAILLMAIALAAVVHGDRTRLRRLEPDAALLLAVYLLLLVLVGTA